RASSLSGNGTIALGGNELEVISPGTAWTFGGVISDGGIGGGTGGTLTVGGGPGTLTGVNTYTGETSIQSGTLALAGNGSIADSSFVSMSLGTFDVSGTLDGAAIKGLVGSGTVVLGSKTLTVSDASPTEFSGVIYGTGGLRVSGGTLWLTGENTYTGLTTIDTGAALRVGNGSSPYGSSGSIASDVMDNGSLTFDRDADITYAGTIFGTGSVTQAGTGTLTLTGTNAYTGETTINSGSVLALTGTGSVGASSGVHVDGTFDISGMATSGIPTIHSLSGSGAVVLGGQILQLADASGNFSGVISGNGGALILAGFSSGTQTLSGVNQYSAEPSLSRSSTLA